MSQKFFRYENGLLAMLSVTFGLVFYDRLAITFLFPFIVTELQLSDTQLGIISSSLALAWAISGYLLSAYADKSGKRKGVLILAVAGFSICTALSGAAVSFIALVAIRAIMGICEGPVLPIVQSIMSEESTPTRRGFNMGFLQNAAGSILALIIGPPLTAALAEALGWRQALYVVAIPGLLMAAMLYFFLHKRTDSHIPETPVQHHAKLSFIELLSYRNIWLGIPIACCMVTWLLVLYTFTPIYLIKTRGMSPGEMGLVMMMLGFGALIWGFVIPLLSDVFGRKPIVVVFTLISALAPLVIAFLDASVPMIAGAAFLTFLATGCFPLVMATIPSETVPHRYIGATLGLIMGVGEVVGGVFAPTLAGMGSDVYGPQSPLLVSSVGALLAASMSLFLTETAPGKSRLEPVLNGN